MGFKMKIKICASNVSKINNELAKVNGEAKAAILAKYAEVIRVIEGAENYAEKFISRGEMRGLVVDHISGEKVANSYKYGRNATSLTLLRGSSAWFVTKIERAKVGTWGGKTVVKFTEKQRDLARNRLEKAIDARGVKI
jgi:hypothetical protein